ncbi:MAG: type IV secretory system conjugative DNA transfer family protein [Oscillospiraceae bacterium]|jgi:type IV secretion system protein VirD4|nr:type IV secretory system conjugative DNA transfer family protein [Oscillospiraceae bacterium]
MKRKKLWKLLLFLPPIVLVVLYGGGYAAQFLANYTAWQRLGGTAGDGTSPVFPSGNPIECLKAVFDFPYGLYGIFVCLILFGLLILLIMRLGFGDKGEYDRERNMTYSRKGTYGTSNFMDEKEMNSVLETNLSSRQTDGVILGKLDGKIVSLPTNSPFNRNIAVYGASGSMKSRAFARNMVFQAIKRGESLYLTDPKSELYESMSQYLRDQGYTVKVFNLVNPEHSDSWNCLAEIEGSELMAQIFSDVVIKNTGSLKGDHFWDNSELNLLKALVLYVEQGYPPESKNIGEVYKLLTLKSERELNALFEILPISHPAKAPYHIFKQAADSIRGGIIIGLGSRLQVFQNKQICQITQYDEIDLELPGKERCAYFVITSDQDSTFDFLVSLFFSFVFIKLVRYADKHGEGGRLPVPVHIIGDEWCNAAGAVFDFCKKISTIRSRDISISIIFQNVAQLKNRYPMDQWQEILGTCDCHLFLGATDELTAKLVSDRSGEVTIGVSSKAKMLGIWRISDYTPEYRETSSIGKRKLMTPDEVLRLPLDKALVILRGQKILKVDKLDYTQHSEYKKLKPIKATEYIPAWRQKASTKPNAPQQPCGQIKPTPVKQAEATTKAVPADKESILS